ncbi:MAG: hypothetical protein KY468_19670, partial [Armatimonadetes bacterium]|nr:hypothetical protein [Armatimonadota bacterium]
MDFTRTLLKITLLLSLYLTGTLFVGAAPASSELPVSPKATAALPSASPSEPDPVPLHEAHWNAHKDHYPIMEY